MIHGFGLRDVQAEMKESEWKMPSCGTKERPRAQKRCGTGVVEVTGGWEFELLTDGIQQN